MSAITNLPTELLLEVASHFDTADTALARLASTCQRFYNTFMHEVLEHQANHLELLLKRSMIIPSLHLSPEAHKADEGAPERNFFDRPFSELSIRVPHMTAIDVRSVRCLICRSKHLRSVDLLVTELCNLRHLAAIMNTCIGTAGLSLRITGSVSEERSPFNFRFYSNEHTIESRTHLADTTVVVTKLGKRYDFWYLFRRLLRLFPMLPSSSPGAQTSSVVMDSPTLSVSVTRRKPNFHLTSMPRPEFSSLHLDGPIPLLQSLYPVTLNALNSRITSLSLHRISFTLFDWAQILPSIALPMLKDLTIGNLSISFPDLLAFLERHESIESLFLIDNNVIGVAKLPLHPILPRLNTLAATSEYLKPFLEHKELGHLPALVNINMSSSKGINGPSMTEYPFPYDDLHPVYDLISGARFSKLRVIVDALRPSGLVDWLLHSKPIGREGRATHHLAGVSTLIVNGKDTSVSNQLCQELQEWSGTAAFPNISQPYDGNGAMLMTVIEALIWTKCAELKLLKLGNRNGLKARPVG